MCLEHTGWTPELKARLLVASKNNDMGEIKKLQEERRQNLKLHVDSSHTNHHE